MVKRLGSFSVGIVLILSVTATSILAQSPSRFDTPSAEIVRLNIAVDTKTEPKPNENLKAGMQKLVSETKAGKLSPRPGTQLPAGKSHNLSKGAKIAIIAGIAVAVVGLVAWYQITHISCKSRCVL